MHDWKYIYSWLRTEPSRKRLVAEKMVAPLLEVLEFGLAGSPEEQRANLHMMPRWHALQDYFRGLKNRGDEMPSRMVADGVNRLIELTRHAKPSPSPEAVRPPASIPQQVSPSSVPATSEVKPTAPAGGSDGVGVGVVPAPAEQLGATAAANFGGDAPAGQMEVTEMTPREDGSGGGGNDVPGGAQEQSEAATTTSQFPAPQWKWLPVPDDPDKHSESDSREGLSPEGWSIIGARSRGKKHRHEGTNCDDWFEFDLVGPWAVLAVSDGAGSKKFSRVGAKAACEAAVGLLTAELKDCRIKPRDQWTSETFRQDEGKVFFAEEDLRAVQEALYRAMRAAYTALERERDSRLESAEHMTTLGRQIDLDDLSATLLLAVHARVDEDEGDGARSFVLTCQVGDGMIAMIDGDGQLKLLGEPDSGEFAGQTDFLTSRNKLTDDALRAKTFGAVRRMRTLMAMTDGVADDYYPNDPGMLRLYGDLILNQVLELKGFGQDEVEAALQATKLPTEEEVLASDFRSVVENTAEGGTRKTVLRSASAYAERLGVSLQDLIKNPALLVAGAKGELMCEECMSPQDRLLRWLDSYHVRGSFDDRTLLVLHRETR